MGAYLHLYFCQNMFCPWWSSYLSTIDDGLETRPTQSVHSESRHWDGNATPQTHMASNVGRIS